VMERMRAVRAVDDFFVTRPLQEAAVELVSAPGWERHLRQLSMDLRERAGALAAALVRDRPDWTVTSMPTGGLHLWLQLPAGTDVTVVADQARRAGVTVDSGNRFFAAEPPAPYLRLTFAAPADVAELLEGARRLATLRE
jgi:DNA-binding transcriptional MocR family regulator